MRAFILAAVVAVVLAAGTSYLLDSIQEPTKLAYATSSVRLDKD